jgi:hypothetical protein
MRFMTICVFSFSILMGINSSCATIVETDFERQKGALQFSFLRLCDDQLSVTETQKIAIARDAIKDLPVKESAVITYDALISLGVSSVDIDQWFVQNKIEIPDSSYLRVKGKGGFSWNSGLRGSWQANKDAFWNNWQSWVVNNGCFLLSTIALVEFVGSIPAAAAASISTSTCQAPTGSYLDTCKVIQQNSYISSDPNLADVPMCKFEFSCTKLNGNQELQTVYLPKADVSCLKYRENCDGHLIMRDSNVRLCTTPEAIKNQVQYLTNDL